MIRRLKLENFKSFKKAELELGNFTLLIGANASGKSNIRDAFRFLHGVGRGYTLADIIGEKWSSGGKEWAGIRGGSKEIIYNGAKSVSLSVDIGTDESDQIGYLIGFSLGRSGEPQLHTESLSSAKSIFSSRSEYFSFSTHPNNKKAKNESTKGETGLEGRLINALQKNSRDNIKRVKEFRVDQAILSQFMEREGLNPFTYEFAVLISLTLLEFIDFDPESLRKSSLPGQNKLGDRGENLPSVLREICKDTKTKKQIMQWIKELTPMELEDFEFREEATGRLNLMLRDSARKNAFSADSASDGTLRFLGMLAALFQQKTNERFVEASISPVLFIEEIDTGIHPAKLHLLIQLIESVTKESGMQVIATTHSPQALDLLNDDSFKHAYLTYRPKGAPDTRLQRIADIPDIDRLRDKYDLGRLHYSGWFENAMELLNDEGSK